jgi:hypothetical protein
MVNNVNDVTESILLEALNKGFELGSFGASEYPALFKIKDYIFKRGIVNVSKADSYKVSTFLLSFPQEISCGGLVVKAVPLVEKTLISEVTRECEVLQQLRKLQESDFIIPLYMGEVDYADMRFFVTEFLSGVIVSEVVLNRENIHKIAKAIRNVQDSLYYIPVGSQLLDGSRKSQGYYKQKVRSYMSKQSVFGLSSEELDFLCPLESFRSIYPTVVSDRSPTNFILHSNQIGLFDFGLLLVGVPFEDWSWFIDDPLLRTDFDRDELLEIFCTESSQEIVMDDLDLKKMFYIASVFVCIKQCCLMLDIGCEKMADHYLECAFVSAKSISDKGAVQLLQKLKDSI